MARLTVCTSRGKSAVRSGVRSARKLGGAGADARGDQHERRELSRLLRLDRGFPVTGTNESRT
jgi:hypothetical protein